MDNIKEINKKLFYGFVGILLAISGIEKELINLISIIGGVKWALLFTSIILINNYFDINEFIEEFI